MTVSFPFGKDIKPAKGRGGPSREGAASP